MIKQYIFVTDIVNIRMQDDPSYYQTNSLEFAEVYAGLCLQKKNNDQITIMCRSKQDFTFLVFLFEASFLIKLPF